MGIKRCETDEQVWRALDQLGDQQSHFLIEKFESSDVFHVDSIVSKGEIVFARASSYGRPPLAVSHGGGVFTSRLLAMDSPESAAILPLNARVIQTLGLSDGVTHIEFLRTHEGKRWLFLEAASRVGGANLSDMIEHGTGVNPWVEWARIELAGLRGEPYRLAQPRADTAGILVCLAKSEHPDLSSYADPEVVWRMQKPYHAGLIVRSPDAARVDALLDDYAGRFAAQFLIQGKPLETGRML
jgi:hypothetical protein